MGACNSGGSANANDHSSIQSIFTAINKDNGKNILPLETAHTISQNYDYGDFIECFKSYETALANFYDPTISQTDDVLSKLQLTYIFNYLQQHQTMINDSCTSVNLVNNDNDDDTSVSLDTHMAKNDDTISNQDVLLVTGGAGFVGGHIAEKLLSKGYKVIVYDIFNSETTPSKEKHETALILQQTANDNKQKGAMLKIITGDICDTKTLQSVIKNERITACFHVAAMVDDRRSVLHPFEYIDVNIKGTVTLLKLLAENNIKTVIQASTRSVFGQVSDNTTLMNETSERLPINPYGATKVAMDAFANVYSHLYDINIAVIRIFATYGPRGRKDMIPRICIDNIHNEIPINKFGDGTATRTWIYISDVVNAFMLAFDAIKSCKIKGYKQYNIGTSESTTLNEMISTATKVVGKPAIINHLSVPKGDAHCVGHSDWRKIKKELGWMPQFTLEEGLCETYKYLLQQGIIEPLQTK